MEAWTYQPGFPLVTLAFDDGEGDGAKGARLHASQARATIKAGTRRLACCGPQPDGTFPTCLPANLTREMPFLGLSCEMRSPCPAGSSLAPRRFRMGTQTLVAVLPREIRSMSPEKTTCHSIWRYAGLLLRLSAAAATVRHPVRASGRRCRSALRSWG